MQSPIIAINYYFGPREMNNRVFSDDYSGGAAVVLKHFKRHFEQRGVDVRTLDTVDFNDPNVKYVIYFDYNWRLLTSDPYLRQVPKEKRVLVLIEPSNINPSMYYFPFLRNQFSIVFSWNLKLLKQNPTYSRTNVFLGAEPSQYRQNPFVAHTFHSKKFLVAMNRNRWSYMPQSTYRIRKQAYRYFGDHFPNDFDLFGTGWNAPAIFYENWLGVPRFSAYRGAVKEDCGEKLNVISAYKFCLCFENNVSEPGYISEKITDCFCARCVPVYYGSQGTEQLIPPSAWINFRDFKNFDDLARFLTAMTEETYLRYIDAIDHFMASPQIDFFSTEHFCSVISQRLLERQTRFPNTVSPLEGFDNKG